MARASPEDLLAHSAWLRRLAACLVDAAVDDVVQDTWVAALLSPPDRDRPMRPWLAQVLRNLVRNRKRTRARWTRRAARIAAADDAPLPTPEELLTHHEAVRLVADLVTELGEPYRSTVLLCYAEELTPSQVAKRQGVPAGTVRWRLKQGLDQLRALLDARYRGDRNAWCLALRPMTDVATVAATAGVSVGVKLAAALAIASAVAGGTAAMRTWNGETVGVRAVVALPPVHTSPSRPPELLAPTPRSTDEALARAMQPGDAPARGPADAPVTIVVFTDFECPHCARAAVTMDDLLAMFPREVRLVFRNFPLPFHGNAGQAAEAVMAAHAQGRFWLMYDRLVRSPDGLGLAALEAHARAIGLDVHQFRRALDDHTFRPAVNADVRLGGDARPAVELG